MLSPPHLPLDEPKPNRGMALASEADALRADFAAILRSIAGPDPDAAAASSSSATAGAGTGARGTEAVVEAFLARTQSLHSAFALEAAQRLKEPITDSVASVREEVAALQRELDEKEALLAAHRENVVRWKAEMHGVTEACAQVEKPSSSSSSGRST